ncbi:S-adenosyl-L-methionine-dependent methyltransferases superfamily protein [Striga hermonthica]|uniref:S-adenosyl-L-methionine-dependent methyltransferases superfamily protein n=1 Tax=Striga hermonthica TaxID=68872 RepID=A0A9N7NMF8_STRHE|nr:S-adenosyl-L-methionine-dependent methyltransferases superfamily protein [Striga hermonthica]
MSPKTWSLETIVPSRYITFTSDDQHLRVAVLDSPYSSSSATAAIWVPPGRESDWVFSTFSGHLQLLLSSSTAEPLSRLILVGRSPSSPHPSSYSPSPYSILLHPTNAAPLLSALIPKSAFPNIGSEIPFLIYEDEVVRASVLEIRQGPRVGEMLVENVELENGEFRRRLRFKRMPNFVQTQMRIRPKNGSLSEDIDKMEFELDKGALVQPYLIPMVASISVISRFLEVHIYRDGFRPRALCVGVGGGALLAFLSSQLNFDVVGVEQDEVVLGIASRYFGLGDDELIRLYAEDGIEFVKKLVGNPSSRFHVIMVDLDSSDMSTGIFAPPVEFVTKSVLLTLRDVMCEEGVVVVNTIPTSELDYKRLIRGFGEVFECLFEIDVGNGENFVLIATKSGAEDFGSGDGEDIFLNKLRSVVSGSYLDSIRKIEKTVV